MKSIIIAILACILIYVSAIDDKCLSCICKIESNCQPLGCKWDVNSNSCGYYQLKKAYWLDCGSPGGGWETCSANKACADGCVRKYMTRYAKKCVGSRTPTCQDFARIHNGGPTGCTKAATVGYWNKVNACYKSG
ncbi:unnamed protein product [Didymodactylos carnosus]|uniref:lysozyme n=1 Tax=Didymodactylos carnosus TaxID=1234261 RepID=A0A816C3Y2_9BILA|nr:unnamed protein product [Didymodactylos carnosus]CAF1615529.1 unnamed protein product [Didymodactylos carnosus]CAF3782320.1 unnamed protein product [Didymodactylos carnosus]CAF4501609.1 unnamed protein product [Didymodactylos carnosus]